MEIRRILYVVIVLNAYTCVVETTTSCEILNQITPCEYTISCEVYAGSARNPTCDYEFSVTFQMINSHIETLSAAFFGATTFDSRVRFFKAINNTWSVISSYTFRYYTKTLEMDLSNNAIRTIYDEAFKNLFVLKCLNVSSNQIETLQPHFLRLTENKDSNLEVLDLSNNVINRIDYNIFEDAKKLKRLYLQNNKISSLADDVFSDLKNLSVLYLQNNELTGLNMTLIHFKLLKELDLSNNRLTKLSGFETNRLTSLERVNISYNKIEIVESNCFNQAFYLQSLDLSNNYIKTVIDNVMFINNGKLNYLNLFNNNITKIESNAFQHNTLLYLNLENNFISGEITEATFKGLQGIKSLNLYKQNVTSIKSNAFSEMTNILYLNLSSNNINAVEESSFKNASLLSVLDLSHNNLSCLNFLKNTLFNLTELYLSYNKLIAISSNTFANQTLVKKLDISRNHILTIEQFSLPLSNLQYLNVSGNPISGIIKSNVLSPARYLRFLDLSGLNISKIDDMAFVDLPVLTRLNLSNNIIETIGDKNFLNLTNLFSLDLSYNRLGNLPLNGTVINNLNALYLNNNKLSNVTGALPNSTQILYLDVSHNMISELTDTVFQSFKNLRVLYASHNKMKSFNNPQMNVWSKLNTLDVSSNQISVIDVSYFKQLVKLDVSNNSLNVINSKLLQNLDYLQLLDISNNNITVLMPGVFQTIKFLKLLNISSNHLSDLRYGTFRGLHSTEVIDLSRNEIRNIDVHVFHECTVLKKLIIDYNYIKYINVDQLIQTVPRLMTLSIGGNPVSCQQIVRIKNINITTSISLEVTSIDKIYHEDNVNGIKCGDVDFTTSTIATTTISVQPETSVSSALLIWCSLITLTFAILIVVYFLYKRKKYSSDIYSQSRIQLGRSVELTGTEFQNDLLN